MPSMVKCRACNRKAESKDLCKRHLLAEDLLKRNYNAWCRAYGKLTWREYLERLLKARETGSWIKDLLKLELE